jgi:triosephosphate isomerase
MDPTRQPLVAGNWKMNAGGPDGCDLAKAVARAVAKLGKDRSARAEVVIAPPFTALAAVSHELRELSSAVMVAAQTMHAEAKGAFTGEVSAAMLREAGARWVILGHSERRHGMGETDEMVAKKLATALGAELRPIVCVGETLEEREAGHTLEVVRRQIQAVLELLEKEPGYAVVAYEPVWAIGTGKVAAPADAQEVHHAIRGWLADASKPLADATRILYGGSVTGDNATGLFEQEDIDGALVGGASLKAEGFVKIVTSAIEIVEHAATPSAPASDVTP